MNWWSIPKKTWWVIVPQTSDEYFSSLTFPRYPLTIWEKKTTDRNLGYLRNICRPYRKNFTCIECPHGEFACFMNGVDHMRMLYCIIYTSSWLFCLSWPGLHESKLSWLRRRLVLKLERVLICIKMNLLMNWELKI